MQYMGGKSRIAKDIAKIIGGGKTLVSLFCGSCAVESKLAPGYERVILNDAHKYLIAMYKAVQNGLDLPEHITREQYYDIKARKDEIPEIAGFVGFGCSFAGVWFSGYARDLKHGRNYAAVSKRSLMKDFETLKKAEFICGDYREVKIPDGATVYADPPYICTTGYGGETFSSAAFWDYMREISQRCAVYISEEYAPEDFQCVWEKPIRRTVTLDLQKRKYKVERLYTYGWRSSMIEHAGGFDGSRCP